MYVVDRYIPTLKYKLVEDGDKEGHYFAQSMVTDYITKVSRTIEDFDTFFGEVYTDDGQRVWTNR